MFKNLEAKYYQENKERVQKKSLEKQNGYERYKNLSENEKQKLVDYRKKIS